jgi:hypothetical protein
VCLFFLILWIAPAAKTADPAAHNAPATRPDWADFSFCTWLKQVADTAPLFRLSPELESLTLHQWSKEHGKNSVILIVDRLWPDSFAQLIPFEKLVQDNPGDNVRYCIIFLHRRPKEFLEHITGIRQADYDRFTASLTSFSHKELNFQNPLIVFIDTNLDVLNYIQEYCNYKCLNENLNVFSSPGLLILKGDNE